jgi:hypothetical protein
VVGENEVSTSDEELDSDFENNKGDEEGPIFVKFDNGKGVKSKGIHIFGKE